jgi:hypothetical protein
VLTSVYEPGTAFPSFPKEQNGVNGIWYVSAHLDVRPKGESGQQEEKPAASMMQQAFRQAYVLLY